MPALDDILAQRLQVLDALHTRRMLRETKADAGVWVWRDGKKLLSFSGNDYLGLSVHPQVIQAGQAALAQDGAGAGASRLVTGNHTRYAALEARLTQMKHTQAALVFGSGYLANLGVIASLMGREDLILADKLVHACMLDGAKLSGAKLLRFAHNDMADVQRLLAQHRGHYRHCLLMSETVFSMDGDVAPLAELSRLAMENDAWLLSDDAHGLGVIPSSPDSVHHIQVGTLSKAAGAYGGYVCGSHVLIDYLISAARSFVFSTGLPPTVVASAEKALEIMQSDATLCARPVMLACILTERLGLPPAQSAIVPIIIGRNDDAFYASAELQEAGFLISAIRPPTVPENTARLRVTVSALHTEAMVQELADAMRHVLVGIRR